LKQALDERQPERLFVSIGWRYWGLLEAPLTREVSPMRLVVATGGIGGRASQLAHWLRSTEGESTRTAQLAPRGSALLLGTRIAMSRTEVLSAARRALSVDPVAARRFETWHVPVGCEHVAPKWLVSVLFDKPVAQFRTADARRVLSHLGVECIYGSCD
jgi:hypothetical protein